MPDLFASTDPHTVFLHPGEFYFGGGPTRIATLLGSCVSITVWHPRLLVGGMCHYMLPSRQRPPQAALCGRYGDEAMEWLLARIRETGAPAAQFQAKLFGGGNMFETAIGGVMDIGRRNIDMGRQLLAQAGISLIAEHVGGNAHRKLVFELWSGDVWLARPDRYASLGDALS